MTIIFIILSLGVLIASFLWKSRTNRKNSLHNIKPINETEKVFSDEFIQGIMNSEYVKSLDLLKVHVTGHKVISSITGNAGFILKLDNNSWASSFRSGDKIFGEYGIDIIPQELNNKINSIEFGDASNPGLDDSPYANEYNNISAEVKKCYGKVIEGLSIGDNTFNFAFENGMELDFQLCNDENNKPSVRIFWEQW
jgi:hypothetical protein